MINAKVPPWTIGNLQVKNNFSHSVSELDKNCGAASVRWLKRIFGFMNWNDKVIWPPQRYSRADVSNVSPSTEIRSEGGLTLERQLFTMAKIP